jgi:hypothetical protein
VTFDPFGDFAAEGYLRNFEKEKDIAIVKRAENASFTTGLDEAFANLVRAKVLTYDDVLKTHDILFGAVYPWAGQQVARVSVAICGTTSRMSLRSSGLHLLLWNPGNGVVTVFGVLFAHFSELFVLGRVQECLYLLEIVEHEDGHPGFGRLAHICCRISRRQIAAPSGFDHITGVHSIFLEIALHVADVVLDDKIDWRLGLCMKALQCDRTDRDACEHR